MLEKVTRRSTRLTLASNLSQEGTV